MAPFKLNSYWQDNIKAYWLLLHDTIKAQFLLATSNLKSQFLLAPSKAQANYLAPLKLKLIICHH